MLGVGFVVVMHSSTVAAAATRQILEWILTLTVSSAKWMTRTCVSIRISTIGQRTIRVCHKARYKAVGASRRVGLILHSNTTACSHDFCLQHRMLMLLDAMQAIKLIRYRLRYTRIVCNTDSSLRSCCIDSNRCPTTLDGFAQPALILRYGFEA